MIFQDLRNSAKVGVSVLSTGNVRDQLRVMTSSVPDDSDRTLFVGRVYKQIPERERLIRDVVGLLADSALAAWPRWYNESEALLQTDGIPFKTDADGEGIISLAKRQRKVLPGWFRRANARCMAGRSPILKKYSAEVQLCQLALAMSWRRFVFVLAIDAKQLELNEAKCFASICLWAAELGSMRIAVLIDDHLITHPGLEAICYDVHSLDEGRLQGESQGSGTVKVQQSLYLSRYLLEEKADGTNINRPKRQVARKNRRNCFAWPVIGVPHPFSPGEQRLAEQIDADPELRGRFRFNWPIDSSGGDRYIVDLFCDIAKLIVEVDGYSTHVSRRSFQSDRDRDFALAIDGYTVVRLTHSEIMCNVEAALAKIRKLMLVRLRNDD